VGVIVTLLWSEVSSRHNGERQATKVRHAITRDHTVVGGHLPSARASTNGTRHRASTSTR